MKRERVVRGAVVAQLLCVVFFHNMGAVESPEKAPRPGHVAQPGITSQHPGTIPLQEQKRDAVFRNVDAQTVVVNRTLTTNTLTANHFNVSQTTYENLDIIQTLTTKNLLVTNGARITGPLDMAGNPILNISTAYAQEFIASGAPATPGLVATGQGTTAAPALRLLGIPNTPSPTDTIVTIDASGNVIDSGSTIGTISGTSGNVPGTLVQRNLIDGGFAAGTIVASLSGNVTGNVTGDVLGNVSGAASANVLKSGDTMTGALRILNAAAPALQLQTNASSAPTDLILALDGSGNVTQSSIAIGSLGASGTSGNVPGTLVLRDLIDGGFAAGTITANLISNITGNVNGIVTGNLLGNVTGHATGNVFGDVTGNVTGNLVGNVLGDVSGNVVGNVLGNVTGNVVGNLQGDVSGNVVGNVSGAASANVLKIGDTMSGQLRVSDASNAAIVATGQSTTQAPALRLLGMPTGQSSDVVMAIDPLGNVTQSSIAVGSLLNGTSANVPNTLVQRDGLGNFATTAITLNAGSTGVAAINQVGDAATGLYFPGTHSVALTANGVEQLVATVSGVGIGTAAPFTQLTVGERLLAQGSTGTDLVPFQIFVQGCYAYVVNSTSNTLQIIDISNPASPTLVGRVTTATNPVALHVNGMFAYLVTDSGSLQIVDVSNQSDPQVVGTLSGLVSAHSLFVQGTYGYVLAQGGNALVVIDVGNPTTPVQVGTVSGFTGAETLYVQGRYGYVADTGGNGVKVVDLNDPVSPRIVGAVSTGVGSAPQSLDAQGRYAYVTCSGTDTFQVVDLGNPSAPVVVGTVTIPGGGQQPWDVFVEGQKAYIVSYGSHLLYAIDVSDPTSPKLENSLTTGGTNPRSLYVQGRYAYVVNATDNTLHCIDLGGAYIQQLEVGGIEAATFATRSDAAIGGELDVRGGVLIGQGLLVTGDVALAGKVTTTSTMYFYDTTNNGTSVGLRAPATVNTSYTLLLPTDQGVAERQVLAQSTPLGQLTWLSATSSNVPLSLVLRDSSGNFATTTVMANLSGNVTGNVAGNVLGNVNGNVFGNLSGNVTGNVVGNVSGAASANVLKIGDTMTGQLRISDLGDAAVVATGQGTTQAPALRLLNNPASQSSDFILSIDSSGNVTQSTTPIGSFTGGTSGNVPNTLVMRDSSGNFAAGTITAALVGNVTGTVSGQVTGGLLGNVTGNVVGDVLGTVTGNVFGNLFGNVTGNVVGNLFGNVTGNVVGNVSGAASANVLRIGDTMTGQLRVSDLGDAAVVATGQGTTQAPALRLLNNPASQSSDFILSIDSSGNVTQSTAQIGSFTGGTSGNVPNTLVMRDSLGNFAAGTITAALVGDVTGNVSGQVTGGLLGNVTGNVVGDVLGTVTGNVFGNLFGNVTGNVVGNLFGNVTGNVVGNVSGAASANVLRIGDTMTGQLRVSDLADAALVATGQSSTQAPALRLITNPSAQASDVVLAIDSLGNITRSTAPVSLLTGATSGAVPNTLVMRDWTGSFAANAITATLVGNVTGAVSGQVTGGLLGNVTGNVVGDVLGDVTGNVFGNLFGNVTGNVVGNLFGNVTGNVVGNVSGAASANVLRIGDTMTGQLRVSDLADAALVATGQSSTQAPALRLVNNPSAQASDVVLAIDSLGNITRSTAPVSLLTGATSGAVPNTLVMRDWTGSFAANLLNAQGLDVVRTSTFRDYVYNLFQTVSPNNVLYVHKGRLTAPNQFSSVKAAVDSIVGNSATNPFVVQVSPGVYVEDTITLKSYVCVRGDQEGTTFIQVNATNKDIINGADNATLRNLTLSGATGAGQAAVTLDGGTLTLQHIYFGSSDILIKIRATSVPSAVIYTSGQIVGTASFSTAFDILGTSALIPCGAAVTDVVWTPQISLASGVIGIKVSGPGSFFSGSTVSLGSASLTPTALTQGVQISNGATFQLASSLIQGFATAFSVPAAAAGPQVNLLSVATSNNTTDISIQDTQTTGAISGEFAKSKVSINAAVSGLSVSLLEPASGGITMVGPLATGRTIDVATNISPLLNNGASLGVISGGLLYTNPASLVVTVSAGTGYLMQTTSGHDDLKLVSWATTTTTVVANTDNFIAITNAGTAQSTLLQPSSIYTIPLGKVRAQATGALFVQEISEDAAHTATKFSDAFMTALGPIYVSGSIVTPVNLDNLSVSSGEYVYASHQFATVGGSSLSWQAYLGGTTNSFVTTQTAVDYQRYDLNGVLTAIPTNYYARHEFFVIGGVDPDSGTTTEQYALVYSQTVYASLPLAEVGNLPAKPSTWTGNIVPIASIIVTNSGATRIAEILDERPRPGFISRSVAGVTVHGNLLGLSADDHPQYLLVNGTRAMSGALNMGTNQIANAGTINGVTLELHGARHGANSVDPIPTGLITDIQAVGVTGAAGTNTAFARADHIHAHGNLPGGSLHALADNSTAGFMSAAEKLLLINATPSNTPSTLVMRDSSGNFSAGTISAGLFGNVTGNVSGNLVGNVSGNITGNIVGNISGAASANVLKIGDTMTGQLRVTDSTLTGLIVTGHSTTTAPAVRLLNNPTSSLTDNFLAIDSSGNVTQTTTQVGTLANATSSNVANTLVLRDGSGNFATSAITLNAGTTGALALNFSGSAGTGLYSPGANQLALVAANAQKLYANTTGVGIGTSAPFTQLTVAGSLTLSGSTGTAGSGPISVYVQGRYAYVTNSGNGIMSIIDVSNPSNPVVVGKQSGLNVPFSVYVQGRYAYIANSGNGTMSIIDVSNPSSPLVVGTPLSTGANSRAVYVQGRYAYVGNYTGNSLSIIDVGNPSSPVVVGTQSGLNNPRTVYVQGRYAYVGNYTGNSLSIIDVGNPSSPMVVGTQAVSSPYSVYVQGRYAYVANYTGNSLSIIDVSNPSNPSVVGTQSTGLSNPSSVYVQGRYAYVVNAGNDTMVVVDISNPNSPSLVGASISTGGTSTNPVYVQGRYAYIVNIGSNNFQIIDLGGAYIQQLEVGGIEAGTLAARENGAVGNDLDVKGGVVAGHGMQVGGDAAFDGRITTTSDLLFYDATGGQYVGLRAPTTVNSSYTLTLPTSQGTAANQVLAQSTTLGQLAWLTATSGNSANTLVLRDSAGNFAAGTISAGLQGNVTGNVFGNLVGNVSGNITGNVVGNVSGAASANVLKIGDTMTGQLRVTDPTLAALVVTGHSTTAAPALRLLSNPTSTNSDNFLAIDSSGNVTQTTTQVGALANATSSNVANTLVLRDSAGNFAAGTITAGLQGNVTGNVTGNLVGNVSGNVTGNVVGNVSGAASANVLKIGDTMTGQLRISDPALASLILTGHSTTAAPALRLFNNPTSTDTDKFLAIDGSGNVTQTTSSISTLANATSANVANTLVLRDSSGNFATSAITLNAGTTGALALNFSGSAGTGLYSPGTNQLALVTNSAQRLYANSTGVGIGTTSPFAQLTVGDSLALAGSKTTGGASRSVYVQGRYAYVADSTGNSLSIVDVSNPSAPVIIGTQTGLAGAVAVYVQGHYAYVANNTGNSLSIIDVSNPSSPLVVGTKTGLTGALAVYVQGRYAYVANGFPSNTMSIIDISNPSSPLLVGTQSIGNPIAVFVQGRYAYVVLATPTQMQIIDVSNPSSPALAGSLALTSNPTSIYVQGRYAYVAFADETMLIIDVSNPSSPRVAGTFVATFHRPGAVFVQGRYAYFISDNASSLMSVVDVSNPANPTLVARLGGSASSGSIFVQGRYAYLATGFGGALQIVDLGGAYIQQLEAGGVEAGTLATRENGAIGNDLDVKGGLAVGRSLHVQGDAAFDGKLTTTSSLIFFGVTGGGSIGLQAPTTVNTSYTLTLPTAQGTAANQMLAQSAVLGQLTWTTAAATSGNSANTFVLRDGSGNFATNAITLNAGTTGAPALNFAGSLSTGLYSPGTNQLALAASGAQQLYANSTGIGIGTTAPFTQLVVGDTLTTAGSTGTGLSTPNNLYVQGRYAYVANNSGSLQVLDVSNASAPRALGSVTLTGTLQAVYVQGRYAFVIGSSGLQIVDVSNPASPKQIGTALSLGISPWGLYVAGGYAYVTSYGGNNLQVIDVRTVTNPQVVGTASGASFNGPRGVYVQGRYAYVANYGSGNLLVIDLKDPTRPTLVGSVASGTSAWAVYVQGRYAYVANATGGNSLRVIDVSNPASPTQAGVITIPGSSPQPLAVYVQGRYAYVANTGTTAQGGSTMTVIDVSNPNSLSLVTSISTGTDGQPYGLFVQGRYAYVANNAGSTLQIIDLGSAYVQQLEAGGLETGTLATRGNAAIGNDLDIRGGAVIGNGLQVTGDSGFDGKVTITSTLQLPTPAAAVSTDTLLAINGSGNVTQTSTTVSQVLPFASVTSSNVANALVMRDGSGNFAAGTMIANQIGVGTSAPFAPLTVAGSTALAGSVATAGTNPWSVYVQGRYAYVVNNVGAKLSIIDVSNPSSPAVIGTPIATGGNNPVSISVQGRYAYVVNNSSDTLSIIDVSNTGSPVVVGTPISTGGSFSISVYVQGRYAYVINYTSGTMSIIDVSNPNSPMIVGTPIATGDSGPYSVYVQGRYAYVAHYNSHKLSIIDVSNPSNPVVVGTPIAIGGSNPISIYVQGRYAYVANYGSGTMSIVDVSNPSSPVIVGTPIATGGTHPYSLAVQGRYVYVVNEGSSTMSVIDVSNPSSPAVVGTPIATGGTSPRSVYTQGRYAYIANFDSNTLSIIDLGSAYVQQLEAGGIEVGTLATRENVAIGNDLDVKGGMGIASNLNVLGQVTAMNASGASGTAVTSPLCLVNVTASGVTDSVLAVDSAGNVTQIIVNSFFPTATSSNIPNTLVKRDNSGNFLVSTLALNAGSTGALALNFTGNAGTGIYSPAANQVALAVKNSQKLVANNTGVGIGTSAPFTQLTVGGSLTLAGSTGTGLSSPRSLYVQGRYAYVANNGTLKVIDVSNSNSLTPLGSLSGLGTLYGVSVQGRYAYVVNNGGTLSVVDVSNPGNLTPVGSLSSLGTLTSIYVQGRYVYLTDQSGTGTLRVIDVSNPMSLISAGSLGSLGTLTSVYVQGRYAYVTDSAGSLRVIDVGLPGYLTSVGTLSSLGTLTSVFVQGRYAYVTDSASTGTLRVIDVSNPASPVSAGTLSGLGTLTNVFVQDRYAYVTDSAGTVRAIDVSSPSAPTLVGTLAVTGAQAVFVQGRFAYVLNNSGSLLQVIDLGGSYIQQLEAGGIETGTLATRENVAIGNDLDVKGGAVFGRGLQATGGSSVLGDLMVTNTNAFVTGTAGAGLSLTSVYLQGRYAYITDFNANLFRIFDVSNPSAPFEVGSVAVTTPQFVVVQGRYAYIGQGYGGNFLLIYDVSNPSNPVQVGSVGTDSNPYNVYVQGRYAYVANVLGNSAQIFDVSDPTAPALAATIPLPGANPPALFVQGRYLYVTGNMTNKLYTIDVSNPTSPVIVSSFDTGANSSPWTVYVQGRYAYVAYSGSLQRLQIIDISDPSNPVAKGSASTLTASRLLTVQGRYAYVPDTGGNDMEIFDVSDPNNPIRVGTASVGLGGIAFVQGRYAYVAKYFGGGLSVVDLGGAYIQQLEAGGIETAALATRSNAAIGNDLDVKGGVAIGRNLNVQGQITAINATGSGTGTAGTAPLRLVNVPSGTFGTQLGVDASGNVGVYSSSARFKENITPLTTESDLLYSLTPVKYDFKPEYGGNKGMYGFIAEDVAKVYPTIINYDSEGRISSYIESTLHALSIKEVQKQQQLLTAQGTYVDSHAATLGMLLHSNTSLQTTLNLHDTELDSNDKTIQALLITIASMQAQINALEKR